MNAEFLNHSAVWGQLVDEAELVVIAFRLDGTIVHASAHLEALLGASPRSLVSSHIVDSLVPPEHRERALKHFLAVANGELSAARSRIPLRLTDGHDVIVRWSRTIDTVLDGTPVRLASGIDVTGQIASESEASTERARLAEAQRVAKLGSWELDHHLGELTWSDEVYRIFEIDASQALPTYEAFLSSVHPDDRAVVDHAYRDSLKTRMPYRIRHRLKLEGERTRWVEERCETRFDSEGRPLLSRGTVQDITATVEAEASARKNETIVSSFLRVSPEAVLVTDRSGKILTFSDGAEQMFRCHREVIIGRQIEDLMPSRYRDHHGRHVTAFAGSAETALRMAERAEIRALRISGEEFAAEATVSKVLEGDDQRFVVIIRDLSERKAYEAALESAKARAEAATQAKSAFLATMSHEIRTPMNGVLGMLAVLEMEELEPQQKEMVGVAVDAGRALMDILNDILDYSRIEAGQLKLELAAFETQSVFKKVHTLHGFKARDAGIAFNISVEPDVPKTLMGDSARLQQILHNLVGNALKFTKKGRVDMVVTSRQRGDDTCLLEISITDTGIGMTSDQIAVIFERFSQADTSITRQFGGTGLGLSIVKGLVDVMGGKITVRSEPGAGSCFTVGLPMILGSSVALIDPQPQGVTAAASPARPTRILIVEDNVLNAKTLRLLLDRPGVSVTVAENGEVALKVFTPGSFDLVLMDIQMPTLDGEAALRGIRKLESNSGAPKSIVVACTAHVDPERNARYLRLGFDNVLAKPIDPGQVADLLALAMLRVRGQVA